MSNLDLLNTAFRDHFPARGGKGSVEFVEAIELGPRKYGILMRLVVWDADPETDERSICDVKEQEIGLTLAVLDLATIARVQEFCAALVKVLEHALPNSDVEVLMPYDLIDFSPLKLAKAHAVDDFVKALSMPSSRLGRYLPNPA